jgi:Xaa-Pro aminopeptidase
MAFALGQPDEEERAAGLLMAQDSADRLFAEIARDLIRPGISESALDREIFELAKSQYGVARHWHKRVVRSGPNTLKQYAEDPSDLTIREDDILFVDLGPVFHAWEADFGRTFVLGSDPAKLKLLDDLERVFAAGKAHFNANPDIQADALYAHVVGLARQAGWEFGGDIAGHLVGEFPHKQKPGDRVYSRIMPGNDQPLTGVDEQGRKLHWILEVHLVDRVRQIGGFYEELLTVS